MKKKLTSSFIIIIMIAYSHQAIINYQPLPIDAPIYNPERGFYIHTEVFSNQAYESLDLYTLNVYKSGNFSIILRVFYLEKFINSNISSSYLTNIDNDFSVTRQAGLKMIVRFAYSNTDQAAEFDAKKPQMLSHIDQLKPLLQKNSDVIYVLQAGFIGAWGEWYYTNNYGFEELSDIDLSNRREIINALLSALPSTRMIQIRTPFYKRNIFKNQNPITRSEAFDVNNPRARIGHHNDCFLASNDDYGTYEDISIDYPFLSSETLYLPMGGETCNPNPPRSSCPTALAELKKFHWSFLNNGYHQDVIDGFKKGGCFRTMFNKLGYRFELMNATLPDKITISQGFFSVNIRIKNSGFGSLFNQRNVFLILRESSTSKEYSIKLKTDPRFWSSDTITIISETIELPLGISSGNYKIFLHLPDSSVSLSKISLYSIRFANQNLWESKTGYNSLLQSVLITQA